MKGIFYVKDGKSAVKSFVVEEVVNSISFEDVEEFLKIDNKDFSFNIVDSPNSFREV